MHMPLGGPQTGRIKRGERAAQRADTRKRKLEAVQAYISALRFSRAILG